MVLTISNHFLCSEYFKIFLFFFFNGCCLLQKSEAEMEIFREAGVPRKQKVTSFNVTDDAIIKPGNLFDQLTLMQSFTVCHFL